MCWWRNGSGGLAWKVRPTKVGERVSARMTLWEVAMYSFFHLDKKREKEKKEQKDRGAEQAK